MTQGAVLTYVRFMAALCAAIVVVALSCSWLSGYRLGKAAGERACSAEVTRP